MIVAKRARNRSAAFQIVVHERTYHVLLELPLEVDHVKRDVQMFRDPSRIIYIVNRTATMLRGPGALKLREAPLIPKLHRQSNDLLPAGAHHRCNSRTVNSATHGHGNRRSGAGVSTMPALLRDGRSFCHY